MLNRFYFILARDVDVRFEINCTNVVVLACKGAVILLLLSINSAGNGTPPAGVSS